MRKYQQLVLLIISCISVVILFMYKTENNRLKDVLHVINFFGRNDAAILKRIDNATINYLVDYLHPLAVWQSIGDNFHGYSAYWKRNELMAGGEAIVLVVGLKRAVLNFRCSLNYKGSSNNIHGKFRFQRIDKDGEDDYSDFTRYNFFCRLTRDFGLPESVTFADLTSKSKDGHTIKLRHIKVVDDISRTLAVQPLTLCVDIVSKYIQNMTVVSEKIDHELLEFFIHHYALGIEDFVVYNGDDLPQKLLPVLSRLNARLHLMPFNFPYSTQNSTERIRNVIERDCILRSANRARHCLLLTPNEFFYSNSKIDNEKSVIRGLNHYSSSVYRFEMPVFTVCKNDKSKYLFENTLYDPEIKSPHALSIHRSLNNGISLNTEDSLNAPSRISLPLSQVFSHRYVNCIHVGKDGLHDWRSSLRADFMQHIESLHEEIKTLI